MKFNSNGPSLRPLVDANKEANVPRLSRANNESGGGGVKIVMS